MITADTINGQNESEIDMHHVDEDPLTAECEKLRQSITILGKATMIVESALEEQSALRSPRVSDQHPLIDGALIQQLQEQMMVLFQNLEGLTTELNSVQEHHTEYRSYVHELECSKKQLEDQCSAMSCQPADARVQQLETELLQLRQEHQQQLELASLQKEEHTEALQVLRAQLKAEQAARELADRSLAQATLAHKETTERLSAELTATCRELETARSLSRSSGSLCSSNSISGFGNGSQEAARAVAQVVGKLSNELQQRKQDIAQLQSKLKDESVSY